MNKMIVIVGKTASGKDTLAKYLESIGYERILEYTTRPIRDGEKDNIDYHFISEEEFINMINSGKFAQYRSFDTIYGTWYYGSTNEDIKENSIFVTNPGALKILLEKNIPLISFYLKVSDEEIIRRLTEGTRKDNLDEVYRRLRKDKVLFDELETYVDYIINGEQPTEKIADELIKEKKLVKKRNLPQK